MIRIAITGPESCGKTSLAERLSNHYGVNFVPEYSRTYLTENGQKYKYEDLDLIAKNQIYWWSQHDADLLLADTDMVVMYVWSMVVFGKVSPFIQQALAKQQFDLYVLCGTDVPWEYDPLRVDEQNRDELYTRYKKVLQDRNFNFIEVSGDLAHRVRVVVEKINEIKQNHPLI